MAHGDTTSAHERSDPDAAHGSDPSDRNRTIQIHIGHDEIVLRHRYEAISIANDALIAVWFTVGSILFFHESTARLGTWMFLIGSIQLGIRPAIRLSRLLHIRRRGHSLDSGTDY